MANKPKALELASQCDPEDAFEVACARELRFLDAMNKDWAAHYEAAVRERDEAIEENRQLRGWVQDLEKQLMSAQNAAK